MSPPEQSGPAEIVSIEKKVIKTKEFNLKNQSIYKLKTNSTDF